MKKYAIARESNSLKDVIKIINNVSCAGGEPGIAVITDHMKKACGVITDGDIRGFFCNEVNFDSPVCNFMSSNFIHVFDDMSNKQQLEVVINDFNSPIEGKDPRLSKVIVLNRQKEFIRITNLFDLYRSNDISLKQVSVYGMGYVGLTLALTFSELGVDVVGIDIQQPLIDQLNDGRPHFFEQGVEPLLKYCLKEDKIKFKNISDVVASDIHIIAVGTPLSDSGNIVYDYLKSAGEKIGSTLKSCDLVICRSTVPAGTTRDYLIPILEEKSGLKAGKDFFIAFAPERTVEGNALQELKTLPQVIGGLTKECTAFASQLFNRINPTIVKVDSLESAEIVKLINNTFRDTVFSFANDVALLCDDYNINSFDVIRAANEGYPRNPIPLPSPGVGGICLVKDPFLYKASQKSDRKSFGEISRKINRSMTEHVFSKLLNFSKTKNIKSKNIFIIGMAFKGHPETSDMRSSPSVELLKAFKKNGFNVFCWDAVVPRADIEKIGGKFLSLEEGIKSCFATFAMNNHKDNADININRLLSEAQNNQSQDMLFFDGWNNFSQAEIESVKNVTYSTLGYTTQR